MQTATPEDLGFSSARLQRINRVMQGYIDRGEVAGLIAMLARRGQIVHFACLGMMNIEADKPMRPDATFRIYSMTKPITTVAFMMLYEEGRFLLKDPVSRFIPEFKELKVLQENTENGPTLVDLERQITIHDLLTHTSGFALGLFEESPVDPIYEKADMLRSDRTLKEFVGELARMPLARQPGSGWQYSVATDVLGYLVQLISGQPFDTFLEQRVFEPLGMVDTGFYVPQDKMDRFTAIYSVDEGGGLILADPPATGQYSVPRRLLSGGGGLVSTTADYFRFCQMMLNGGTLDGARLLGRKTVELMTMNHVPDALLPLSLGPLTDLLAGYGFGLGFAVLVDVAQSQALGSTGEYWWGGAAGTYFWIDPKEEVIGILMQQLMGGGPHPIAKQLGVLTYQAIVD